MVADQEKVPTQGIKNEHDDGFDDADSVSALSAVSRFRSQLQQRVWQQVTRHAHGSRHSLHATVHSAQSQDTFCESREGPCASEATVSLGQLPSRRHAKATRLKRAALHNSYSTEHQGEQREIQRSNFTGKAAWSDSDGEEEYQSRCITIKGQPVKRHKPKQQDNHQHAAGMSGSPGQPSIVTWPAEHSPHLARFLIAKEKQPGGSLGADCMQQVPPFHPLPHDLDAEE